MNSKAIQIILNYFQHSLNSTKILKFIRAMMYSNHHHLELLSTSWKCHSHQLHTLMHFSQPYTTGIRIFVSLCVIDSFCNILHLSDILLLKCWGILSCQQSSFACPFFLQRQHFENSVLAKRSRLTKCLISLLFMAHIQYGWFAFGILERLPWLF